LNNELFNLTNYNSKTNQTDSSVDQNNKFLKGKNRKYTDEFADELQTQYEKLEQQLEKYSKLNEKK
ncbi:MAG: hypothetical protein HQL46_10270, partial [Gammaproteobacteria bacterium]|nr:hypothetical protein [Gammaproteobacteria bacterium]